MKLLLATLLAMWVIGCSEAEYAGVRTKADNEFTVSKGIGGLDAGVRVGADTEAEIKDFQAIKTDGTSVKLGSATFKAAPSTTIKSWEVPMAQYVLQQNAATERRRVEWAGFNEAWAKTMETIQSVAPIAGNYLEGRNQVALAKAQRPQLIQQLAGLIQGGQMDPREMLEPDVLADVNRRIDQMLAEGLARRSVLAPTVMVPIAPPNMTPTQFPESGLQARIAAIRADQNIPDDTKAQNIASLTTYWREMQRQEMDAIAGRQ